MKKALFTAICLLTMFDSFSQNIQRKAGLGVGFYQKVPDS